MKCTECKGTGKTVLLTSSGPCKACRGTGRGLATQYEADITRGLETEEQSRERLSIFKSLRLAEPIFPIDPDKSGGDRAITISFS